MVCTVKAPGLSDNRKGILDNLAIPTNGVAFTGKEDIRLECTTSDPFGPTGFPHRGGQSLLNGGV